MPRETGRQHEYFDSSALFAAIEAEDVISFLMSIEGRPNLDIRNSQGNTPLIEIIRKRKHSFFNELIINRKVNVNYPNSEGSTPLMEAVKLKEQLFVHQLLDKGADVRIKDNNGKTALAYAIENKSQILQLILRSKMI